MSRELSNNHKKFFLSILCAPIFLLSFFALTSHVHAATLQFSPATSKASIGNLVPLRVTVGTNGQAINNVDSVIQFPTDLLEVVSLNKGSSIFSLWVEEPSFSNTTGVIRLNGGLPNPGYVGQAGEVLSIVLRAKKAGTATLVFGDSAVRLNDGLGTDALTSRTPVSIEIGSGQPLAIPAAEQTTPSAPLVRSSTHPNTDTWYPLSTASFTWLIPDTISSLQTLVNTKSDSVPTVTYDNSVSQRTVNNLPQGVSYFHIRYLNEKGPGPATHFKVQVDTAPPELAVSIQKKGPRNLLAINAGDVTSGIEKYTIQIDGGTPISVSPDSLTDSLFALPLQTEGGHKVKTRAYDRAGNYSEKETVFESSAIETPSLSLSQDRIEKNKRIEIRGTSVYTGSPITVVVQPPKKEAVIYTTRVDEEGKFTVTTDELTLIGGYSAYAQLQVENSSVGPKSNILSFKVTDTAFVQKTKTISYTLLTLCMAIALLLALLFMIYLGWHKFFGLKKKLHKELKDTEVGIHKAFVLYKEELENQLAKLEALRGDRDLNQKEQKIFKELSKNITDIDEFIQKKLKKLK